MWIQLGYTHARLTRASGEERAWLREYLSFPSTSWRGGAPRTEVMRMFSLVDESFPAGFLSLVKKAAQSKGFEFEVIDTRVEPCPVDPNADLSWLRDYQLAAVDAAERATRCIIRVPTGGGKTEIAAGLARRRPGKWAFLVHRATLLDQAAERFTLRTGEPAGRLGDGQRPNGERFVCATFQTLFQMYDHPMVQRFMQETDGLLIDECHVLPADSFWKVAMGFKKAYWRIGLSGTPLDRGDRKSVLAVAALGSIAYQIKPETLIAAGVLSRPKIRLTPVYQESQAPTWQGVYGDCIVRSAKRNRVLLDCASKAEKPCLVFVKEIKHGKALLKLCEKAGIKADFVWGTDSTDARKKSTQRLVRGEIEVLICSVIFQEGVDIPELRSVVIGSGGKSIIAALQRIGRGMRVADGKTTFEVWDIADRGNKWLERHTQVRLRAYTREGHETVILPSIGGELTLTPAKPKKPKIPSELLDGF